MCLAALVAGLRGRLHQVAQVGAREAGAPQVERHLLEHGLAGCAAVAAGAEHVDVLVLRMRPRLGLGLGLRLRLPARAADGVAVQGAEDVDAVLGGGQADVDAGAEAARAADGLVDDVGPMPERSPTPSSSVSRVLTTRALASDSESSRRGTSASISSKNRMQGADDLARANSCRTARSDSPTYLLSSSGPLMEMKLALDSLATALATSVLPHPGGPQSRMPAAGLMPTRLNSSGFLIGPMMDISSFLRTSSSAPTSAHVVSGMVLKPSRLEAGWTRETAVLNWAMVMRLSPQEIRSWRSRSSQSRWASSTSPRPSSSGCAARARSSNSVRFPWKLSETAALTTYCRSLPTKPGVILASFLKSTSSARLRSRVSERRICSRARSPGMPMSISVLKRRRMAESRKSGRLVAANTTTFLPSGVFCLIRSMPFMISATMRLSMPLLALSRLPAMASISSMNTRQGASRMASSNTSRMFFSDSPEVPPTMDGADMGMKATPMLPATAWARVVLPQPDGPWSRTPLSYR
ncbi:4e3ffe51-bece-491c-8acf-3cf2ac38d958 [Thermothielavioides terrestris]|uniref:4e3ffe51-bece-491c-8acf-3cf2ac38d958 n=1 Tax=Thermothielavioides terrestris TaxID=2587410 RepID=A0A446BYP2_9PEZI|nr:4e3ffe51-bece-491c-8acf-3cf2ac38d958 [Thermothielavioides terrestris]